MMPISGTAALMARTARQTRLRAFSASDPVASRKDGSVLGNSAIAGMRKRRGALGLPHRLVDGQALDARHRRHGVAGCPNPR